jgi:serine/threonine protein kinase
MGGLRTSDPASIGPYRLVLRIGSGGMGVAYRAEDDTGTRVAIKLIRDELAQDPHSGPASPARRELDSGSAGCAPPASSPLSLIRSTPTL